MFRPDVFVSLGLLKRHRRADAPRQPIGVESLVLSGDLAAWPLPHFRHGRLY